MKLILTIGGRDFDSHDVEIGLEADSKEELCLAIFEAVEQQCGPELKRREEEKRAHTLTPEKRRKHVDDYPIEVKVEFNGQKFTVDHWFSEHDVKTLDEYFESIRCNEES